MNSIFDMDSPLMKSLGKLADLMILNFLTMVCCVPLVTVGAAVTALHSMCLKIARDEESYIIKGYFKAFKENFKQSTGIWFIILWVIAVVVGDLLIMRYATVEFPFVIRIAVFVAAVVTLCTSMWVFPMQARFANPVSRTIKNAFKASVLQFPRTILMVAIFFVPALAVTYVKVSVPIVFLFGFSFHAYLSVLLYNKFFLRLEAAATAQAPAEENGSGDSADDQDERIFHDELDSEITQIRDENLS